MEIETTWEGWKKLFQVIVKNDSAPNDHFVNGFAFIPSSPQQCCAPKRNYFHPFCSKFNIVWGGGGVASFTNISGQVLTLLTSLAVATYDNGIWTF